MCSEAWWKPPPKVLHSLMSYNLKKIGGFWFWFLCLRHTFTGEIVLAVYRRSLQKQLKKATVWDALAKGTGQVHTAASWGHLWGDTQNLALSKKRRQRGIFCASHGFCSESRFVSLDCSHLGLPWQLLSLTAGSAHPLWNCSAVASSAPLPLAVLPLHTQQLKSKRSYCPFWYLSLWLFSLGSVFWQCQESSQSSVCEVCVSPRV